MKLFNFFTEGGTFLVVLVMICGLLMLFFSVKKAIQMSSKHEFNLLLLDRILLFGSLALLFGILDQAMSFFYMMRAISVAGDISASLLAEGLKISIVVPISSLIIFIVSLIIWAVLKEINHRKTQSDFN